MNVSIYDEVTIDVEYSMYVEQLKATGTKFFLSFEEWLNATSTSIKVNVVGNQLSFDFK